MKLLAVLAVIVGMGASSQGSEDIGVISPEEYRTLHKFSWRIAGGLEASPGKFPFQGVVKTYGFQSCGAVLVSPRWALTAAFCVKKWLRADVYFGLSANNSFAVHRVVNRIIVYPSYNQELIHHNLALLKFDAIDFDADPKLVHPVAIADLSDGDFAGWVAMTIGYGKISDGGPRPDHLRYANLTVISNEECKKIYGDKYIIDQQLCAVGVGDPPKGVCLGDSGGPLVVGEKDNVRLIGLTSFWSKEGCDKAYPSGFVRINQYKAWIDYFIIERSA